MSRNEAADAEKAKRRAEALRANLRRRKAAPRRAMAETEPPRTEGLPEPAVATGDDREYD